MLTRPYLGERVIARLRDRRPRRRGAVGARTARRASVRVPGARRASDRGGVGGPRSAARARGLPLKRSAVRVRTARPRNAGRVNGAGWRLAGRSRAIRSRRHVQLQHPRAPAHAHRHEYPLSGRLRVTTRGIQIALGVVWLLDGLFQFKSFMYTHGIITEVFGPAAERQWSIVGGPMKTFDELLRARPDAVEHALRRDPGRDRPRADPQPQDGQARAARLLRLGAGRVVVRRGLRRADLEHAALAADGRARRGDPLRDHRPARVADGQGGGALAGRPGAARRPRRAVRLVGAVGAVGGPVAGERQPRQAVRPTK